MTLTETYGRQSKNTAEDNVLNMETGERSQVSTEIHLKIIKIQIKHKTVNDEWFFPD